MLSTLDSPPPEPIFCRIAGVSCNAISVAIKEIRSSLSLATTIINDTSDTYFSMVDGHRCKSKIYFECGRLKYSRVKEEWSILHRPLGSWENSREKSTACKHSIAMVIASLHPKSTPERYVARSAKKKSIKNTRVHAKRLSKILERRHCNENSRDISIGEDNATNSIDEGCCSAIDKIEIDHKKTKSARTGSLMPSSTPKAWLEGQPTPPPIDLVRHLLSGAEFTSIMSCARQQVETSIQKMKEDVEVNNTERNRRTENRDEKTVCHSKTRFSTRPIPRNVHQSEMKLQAMIVALVEAMSNASSSSSKPSPQIVPAEKNDRNIEIRSLAKTLRFIDECIQYAHFYTMDLIADWSDTWEIRTNLLTDNIETIVEDECLSSSETNATFYTKYMVMSRLAKKGGIKYDRDFDRKKDYATSVSLDTLTTTQGFVRACLVQPFEDIVQSNTSMIGLFQTPFSNCDSNEGCDVYNHNRSFGLEPRRIKVFRSSKVVNREPADSLASTCVLQKQNTPSTIVAHNENLLVKKQRRRVRNGGHITCNLPSVLENTTRVAFRERTTPIQISKNDPIHRRNYSDSPTSSKQVRTSDKIKTVDKKHIHCDLVFDSYCDIRIEKEKMLSNLRHTSVGVKCNQKQTAVQMSSTNIHSSKDMDKSFSKIQLLKDWSNPRMTKRYHGTSRKSLIEDDINRRRLKRKQIKLIGSLQQNLSTTAQHIPATQWSSNGLNLGHNSSSGSIDYNSVISDFIERAALENRSLSSIQEARIDDPQNIDRFTQLKKGFHIEAKKPIGRVATIDTEEMTSQSAERKIVGRNKHHLVDRCQDLQLKSRDIKTNSNANKDTKILKGDKVNSQRVSNVPWIRLSHVGHISDYHGYKRKYEHFAPLQFGSLENVRIQIRQALTVTDNERNDEESDEDIIQDNKDYEQAIQKYEMLAEIERTRTSKNKIQRTNRCPYKSDSETLGEMLVIFPKPESNDTFALPVSERIKKQSNIETLDIDESSLLSQPPIKFHFFDDEDCVFMKADKSSEKEKPKRKSRSAQIEIQKKVSIQMLKEMLYTLNFIEKYNLKEKDVKAGTKVTKKLVTDEKRKVNSGHCGRKFQNGRPSGKFTIEEKPTSTTATINALNVMKCYENLRNFFPSSHTVCGKRGFVEIKEDVQNILDKNVLLHQFFGDDEIVSEERSLARCIRGYSSKADQEKIERRNFEEQQKLRKHEFEYYRLRKKKKSPEEIEWKKLSSRPIYYVINEGSLLPRSDTCNFQPNCSICDPMLGDKYCKRAIFFPKFRFVGDGDHVDPNAEQECHHANNVDSGIYPSSNGQKLATSLKLMELTHTLGFIENYNNGMMISKKRRLK